METIIRCSSSEAEYPVQCPDCGQFYDRHDLHEVFRHEHRRYALPHFPFSYAVETTAPFRYFHGIHPVTIN